MSAALLLCAALQQKPEFARVATLQSDADWKPVTALVADLDGDGKPEVVVASTARGKGTGRRVEIWGATGAGGTFQRGKLLDLTPDVISIAVGNVLPPAGDELVLFSASGVFALSPLALETRAERLTDCEFLWQAPDPGRVHVWSEGVRDLDGDGLVDLVLPEPDGFLLVAQRRPRADGGPWGIPSRVRVPVESDDDGVWLAASRADRSRASGRPRRPGFTLELTGGEEEESLEARAETLVVATDSVNAPRFVDWDADRDLDLVVQTSHHLHVFAQERASFPAAPTLSLALPVDADSSRRLDMSYSSHAVDLDLDRRADCVIFAGDKRSEDVRTQALFFAQAATKQGPAPFGAEGRPSSLLVFAGFIADPRFIDLDGDGYPELVLRAVRPDLIDQMRSLSSQSIETDLYVYRNRKGLLSRQPDVSWRRTIPLERFQLTAEFCGDLTGDGLSELVARDEPDKLRVMFLRAQGAGEKSTWTLFEKPLWETAVHEDAVVRLVPAEGKAKPALIVIEPTQVLFVRFP